MKNNLAHLYPLMTFISHMVGLKSEIVLYNVHLQTVEYVINPFDEEMVAGSAMRSLERKFLADKVHLENDFIVNYRALSKTNRKLKSGTYFIKDHNKVLTAILTINVDVDLLVDFRDMLNALVSGTVAPSEEKMYDQFDISVDGFVQSSIKNELSQYPVEASRLSSEEKAQMVKSLDKKGFFLIKGAITELAKVLGTTETTIYRYLSKK